MVIFLIEYDSSKSYIFLAVRVTVMKERKVYKEK